MRISDWSSDVCSSDLTLASDCGLIDAGLKLRTLRLPDIFQDQDKPEKQYADAGLDADGIVETVLKALRYNDSGVIEGARACNSPPSNHRIALSAAGPSPSRFAVTLAQQRIKKE